MAIDQLTLPLSDEDLVRLAEHRHAQADREGATIDDYVQLADIFPAVLQRLQDKIKQAGEFIEISRLRDAEFESICY
ncbi:hypothetical protein [Novosphingobium sp.]|uniref:hypothetical protein n=1 Tax=Novosphingobium sp. TaxID=1874826 RepID=UPI0028B1472A|nr:hypothetical protein [Novosphingobium sp.]